MLQLFRKNGIDETILDPSVQLRTIHEQGNGWTLPTIFISSMVLSNNPHIVTLALNVIGNYLSQFFHGTESKNRQVVLDILMETDPMRSCKKISYRGGVDGLSQVVEIVEKLNDESR